MAKHFEDMNNTGLNPKTIIGGGLLLIALTFLGFGTWAAVAPLSGAIIARGVVKVDSNRKTVQHLEGGIVKEIRVRNGDLVEAGQTLIVIEDEEVGASLDLVQGQLHAELAKAARLRAERDGRPEIAFPESLTDLASDPQVAELLQGEITVFEAKRHTLDNQIVLLEQQISEARTEIAALAEQVEAEDKALAYLQSEIAANAALEKRHVVAKVELLRLRRSAEEYRVRRGEHRAEIAKARQRITDLNLKIMSLRNNAVQTAADELTKTLARIYDLEEQIRPSRDALKRQHIVAPVRGKVVDMKVFTVGGVIGPREPLLDIVPDDSPLIVEAQVGVESIDDLHPEMEADIQLTAYSARTTPLIVGRVSYISADRLIDEDTGAVYYSASIQVNKESLASAAHVKLYPGMPAEVFIKTAERTALDYLLDPVTTSLRRALREP